MKKTYVTFGQSHVHSIRGYTIDKDCVAVIKCNSAEEGREIAFKLFGPKFCFEYHDKKFDMNSMHFYPRGFIQVN